MWPQCWQICDVRNTLQDAMEMVELAVSAMSMLSTRADGRTRLRDGQCIAALVAAFKPCMDDLILEHVGSALGNLANHTAAREQMKEAGLVGMTARLLRLKHRPRAQVCSCLGNSMHTSYTTTHTRSTLSKDNTLERFLLFLQICGALDCTHETLGWSQLLSWMPTTHEVDHVCLIY
jgi:hypothetical protein